MKSTKYSCLCLALVVIVNFLNLNCTNRPQTKSGIPFSKVLNEAQKYYWNAEFDNALKLISSYLSQCIKRKIQPEKSAFILLPQIYIKKNDYVRARNAIGWLLKIDPKFTPNPNDYPIHFVDLVKRVKRKKGLTNSSISKKD